MICAPANKIGRSKDSQELPPEPSQRIQNWLSDDGLDIQGRLISGRSPPPLSAQISSQLLAFASELGETERRAKI
jgi:hypothetical protein